MGTRKLPTKMQRFNSKQYRQFFYYDVSRMLKELIKINYQNYEKTKNEDSLKLAKSFEQELQTFQERYSDYKNSGMVFIAD